MGFLGERGTLQFLPLIITAARHLLLQSQSSQKQLQSEIQEGKLDDIKRLCPKMELSILSFTATIERLYFQSSVMTLKKKDLCISCMGVFCP